MRIVEEKEAENIVIRIGLAGSSRLNALLLIWGWDYARLFKFILHIAWICAPALYIVSYLLICILRPCLSLVPG